MQTTDHLEKRHIVPVEANLNCILCNECIESSHHLLFESRFAHYIRTSRYIWYGDIRVLPSSCIEHFWQHKGSIMGKKSSSIWWTVWASAVWGIWLHRNDQLYNDKPIDSGIVLDTIFPGAWSWCKIFVKDFDASLYAWNINPREWLMQLE